MTQTLQTYTQWGVQYGCVLYIINTDVRIGNNGETCISSCNCQGYQDVPAMDNLFVSCREGIRPQEFTSSRVLWPLMPCSLISDKEGCPVHPQMPSASPKTAHQPLKSTLHLESSSSMNCSWSTSEGYTSDVIKWKLRCVWHFWCHEIEAQVCLTLLMSSDESSSVFDISGVMRWKLWYVWHFWCHEMKAQVCWYQWAPYFFSLQWLQRLRAAFELIPSCNLEVAWFLEVPTWCRSHWDMAGKSLTFGA